MVRRSLHLVFGGGAHVFPGGAVDEADGDGAAAGLCEGLSDADASAALGVPNGGLAFWVAAIRECFEESGYLLAYDAGGEIVRLGAPRVTRRFTDHRSAVQSGDRRLAEVCIEEHLRLAADALSYVSRWITPEGAPRRFDTRFFLGAAPAEQTPVHDATETIAHEWVRPGDVLARYRRGEVDLMTPTERSLEWLDAEATVVDVLAAAAASGPRGNYQRG